MLEFSGREAQPTCSASTLVQCNAFGVCHSVVSPYFYCAVQPPSITNSLPVT